MKLWEKILLWVILIATLSLAAWSGWHTYRLWSWADATQTWLAKNVVSCRIVDGVWVCSDPDDPPPKPCSFGACP